MSTALPRRRFIFALRLEEAVALAFLLPTSYLTLAAVKYASDAGVLTDRHAGGVPRLAIATLLLGGLLLAHRVWPRSPAVSVIRDVLPFLTCILVYTNLHDTIGFVNPHDVHHTLAALDRELFGVIPCVWTERFITPARTELMQFLYFSFAVLAPSMSVTLLAQRRWREFRVATLGVVTCFLLGYGLYILFPAAPPRLTLVYEFTKTLEGYPLGFSSLNARAFELLPVDSRGAFPSLHTGVSTVVLIYAWRFTRRWFWVALPLSIGLWASTIYLRHHYVVDLFAGWLLAPVAVMVAPRVDRWWTARQRAYGYEPPRGAEPTAAL